EVAVHQLDGDAPGVAVVMCAVDAAHATLADQLEGGVAGDGRRGVGGQIQSQIARAGDAKLAQQRVLRTRARGSNIDCPTGCTSVSHPGAQVTWTITTHGVAKVGRTSCSARM